MVKPVYRQISKVEVAEMTRSLVGSTKAVRETPISNGRTAGRRRATGRAGIAVIERSQTAIHLVSGAFKPFPCSVGGQRRSRQGKGRLRGACAE